MRHPRFVSVFACASLVSALGLPSAEAQIHMPGTQPVGEEGGIEVLIQDSQACRNCHGYWDDDDDFEPYDSWRGSMMANAGRDPIARAAIAIAEADNPDAADFCLRCHTPGAWMRGRSTLPDYDASNPGHPQRLMPDRPGSPVVDPLLSGDLDGVVCMVCHRMTEPPEPSMIANAQLVLADGDQGDVRRGPYAYASEEGPRHPAALEPFVSDSALCGSCHDITNPTVGGHRGADATGRDFAIERTYSEWRYSAFSSGETERGCMDCHMPERAAYPADPFEGGTLRPTMNRHDLAGGNVWVPLALAEMVRPIDARASAALEAGSVRAEAMLQDAASIEIVAPELTGARATATVRVTNLSGHKLPTGYPEGRRMWLEIEVRDASGTLVASSGRYDDETDELVPDAQLRTYEAKLGQGLTEGFHFVLNDTLLEDTRIPPRGFAPPPEADVEPLGRDYTDGAGGYRHWDDAPFAFDALCGEGELTLRARLRYQTTTRAYIEFLRDHQPPSSDPALEGRTWGDVAYDAWREHGGDRPTDMVEASVVLGTSPGACPDPSADAGPHDGGEGTSLDASTARDGSAAPEPLTGGCACSTASRALGGAAPWWTLVAVSLLLARIRWGRRRVATARERTVS